MIKSPAALRVSISTGLVSTRVAAAVTGSTAQSTGGVSTEAARIKISTDIEREERERGGGRRLAGQALESSAGGIRLCQGQSPRNQDLKIQQVIKNNNFKSILMNSATNSRGDQIISPRRCSCQWPSIFWLQHGQSSQKSGRR